MRPRFKHCWNSRVTQESRSKCRAITMCRKRRTRGATVGILCAPSMTALARRTCCGAAIFRMGAAQDGLWAQLFAARTLFRFSQSRRACVGHGRQRVAIVFSANHVCSKGERVMPIHPDAQAAIDAAGRRGRCPPIRFRPTKHAYNLCA